MSYKQEERRINQTQVMDETLENSQTRQKQVSSYFRNEANSKLKNMNLQEESSFCETVQKSMKTQTALGHSKQQSQAFDFSDLLHQSSIQNDSLSLKECFRKSEKHSNMNDTNYCVKPLAEIKELNQNGAFEESKIFSPHSTLIKKESLKFTFKRIESKDVELPQHGSSVRINKKGQSERFINKQNEVTVKANFHLLLKIRFLVMKFFKSHTLSGRSKQLNKAMRKMINDQSDVISGQAGFLPFYLFRFCRSFQWKHVMESSIPLINPQSMFGFFIKFITTIVNFIILFVFSLVITFEQLQSYQNQFSTIISIIWVLDILISVNTAPFYLQIHKSDRKSIIIKYFRKSAFFDIVPFIFINLMFPYMLIQIIANLLVFLKAVNLLKDIRYIQKRICMLVKRYYLIQVINLIIKLFLLGHVLALLWYLVGVIELNILQKDKTWFDNTDDPTDWFHLYIWALYWALTLMSTGSNIAGTFLQAVFTSFTLLFTAICFGYFINAIGFILSEIDERFLQKRKDINIINDYMREKNISKSLQSKVNIDLDYFYKNNFKKKFEDNMQVLDKISVELKKSLLKEYNKQIIGKIPLLQKNFSPEVLEELSLFMKEEYYFPQQTVWSENDSSQSSLLFIVSGQIEVILNEIDSRSNSKKILLNQNQSYGEEFFISGLNNSAYLCSQGFTKIIRIERDIFISLIRQHHKDFEVFYQIRDKLMLYHDFTDIDKSCRVCSKKKHFSQNCPLVILDKERLFEKEACNQRSTQSRDQQFKRGQRKQFSSFLKLNDQQEKIKELQEINKQLIIKQAQSGDFTFTTYEDIDGEELSNTQNQEEEKQTDDPAILDNLCPDMQQQLPQRRIQQSTLNELDELIKPEKQKENNETSGTNKIIPELRKRLGYESLKLSTKDITQITQGGGYDSKQLDSYESDINSPTPSNMRKTNSKRRTMLKALSKHQLSMPEEHRQEGKKYQRSGFKQKTNILQTLQTQGTSQVASQATAQSQKRISTIYNIHETNNNIVVQSQIEFSQWDFEMMKDYKFYFVQGNSKYVIQRLQRYQKKSKKNLRKNNLNVHTNIINNKKV